MNARLFYQGAKENPVKIRPLAAVLGAATVLSCLNVAAFAQKPTSGATAPSNRPATTAAKSPSTAAKRKPLPARDPKTGRFIKSGVASSSGAAASAARKTPLRDPKTGRFMKSTNSGAGNKAKP